MDHLTSSHWWWDIALQGVVGSIIGGLVTVAALVITLRWQGRQAAEDAIRRECTRLASQSAVLQALTVDSTAGLRNIQLQASVWASETTILLTARREQDPRFYTLLNVSLHLVMEGVKGASTGSAESAQQLAIGLQCAQRILLRRAHEPTWFGQLSENDYQQKLAQLPTGGVVL